MDDNDDDDIEGAACGPFHLLGQRVMDLVSAVRRVILFCLRVMWPSYCSLAPRNL